MYRSIWSEETCWGTNLRIIYGIIAKYFFAELFAINDLNLWPRTLLQSKNLCFADSGAGRGQERDWPAMIWWICGEGLFKLCFRPWNEILRIENLQTDIRCIVCFSCSVVASCFFVKMFIRLPSPKAGVEKETHDTPT